jgi:poly-beta-1,6-N-acetyl-D-glucosamine N-deacetylase
MSSAEKIAKKILIRILFYSGLPVIFREFIQRNRVTILVLHDPKADIASGYFEWLSRHYNIISLNQYLATRTKEVATRLPSKSLVITLDDGHVENYKLLHLAKQYNISLTIFLCSGIVNTNRHYWFRFSGLPSSSETLKVITDQDRLRVLYQAGFYPEKEFAYPQALNKSQIAEMKEYINFQGHTVFHPCLPQCSDQKSMAEIEQSKTQLEQEFNLSINALAYPNGEYTDREIQFAQKAGYTCAVTTGHGFNDNKTDLFRLRRLGVGDRDSIKLLAIKASGIWAFLIYVSNGLKKVKHILK